MRLMKAPVLALRQDAASGAAADDGRMPGVMAAYEHGAINAMAASGRLGVR